MSRRSTQTILILIAFLLGSCTISSSPEPPKIDLGENDSTIPETLPSSVGDDNSGGNRHIIVTFGAPDADRQVYEPLIAAFNNDNTDVSVQFVAVEETNLASNPSAAPGQTMQAIATAADTAALSFLRPEYIANDVFRDLTPLIDADTSFDRADFFPAALPVRAQAVRILPVRLNVPLLSYNKDLWVRSSLQIPSPNWTWSDLLTAAEQLARKRNGTVENYGLLSAGDTAGAVLAMLGDLQTAGIDLLNSTAAQTQLDQPAVIAALERTGGRIKSGALAAPPDPKNRTLEDVTLLIREEKAGLWPMERWDDPSSVPFAVGIAAYPEGTIPTTTLFQGLAMSSGASQPEAAWRWLSFLSRQSLASSPNTLLARNIVPARASVATNSGMWQQFDSEAAAALEAMLARPSPSADSYKPSMLAALTDATQAMVYEGQDAAQALREAQRELVTASTDASFAPAVAVSVATPAPTAAANVTRIRFEPASGSYAGVLPKVIQRFEEEHPEIQIMLVRAPLTANWDLASMAARSDCFVYWAPFPDDTEPGVLNLQPIIDADPDFQRDDYLPSTFAPLRRDGALLGLPLSLRPLVIGYNKQVFDAVGQEYPRADWTFEDFERAVTRVSQGEGNARTYGFVERVGENQVVEFMLDQFDAILAQEQGEVLQPNYTDPKVVEAMRAYLDLYRTGSPFKHLATMDVSDQFGSVNSLIRGGQAAMWLDWGATPVAGLSRDEAVNPALAKAPIPLGQSVPTFLNEQMVAAYISAQTPYSEACWTWLKYLSEDVVLNEHLGTPVRISIGKSDAYTTLAPTFAVELFHAYQTALSRSAVPNGASASLAQLPEGAKYWFYRALDNALQGNDLERELADAQFKAEQFIACTGGGESAADCAKRVAPNDPGWAAQ